MGLALPQTAESFDQMTNLGKDLRAKMPRSFPPPPAR
jgi:adenine C2-methylase RlmN of 23S rRNA A2503 and tRNA A37